MNLSQNNSRSSRGFTLLEMMVVIAIITTLSTLTWINAPALLGASRLRSGANDIHNQLSLARMTAINSCTPSILVIRTTGINAWKSVAVFSMNLNSSDWTQIGAWHTLPQTVQVDQTYLPAWPNTKGVNSTINSVAAPLTPLTQAGTPLTHDADYLSIGFLPDGSMMANENVALKVIRNPGDTTATVDTHNWIILLAERAGGRIKVLQSEK